jgi:hypothetical protein
VFYFTSSSLCCLLHRKLYSCSLFDRSRYILQFFVFVQRKKSRETAPGETLDPGLPDRMMAAPGVVTPVDIFFGAEVGWRWCCSGGNRDLGLPDQMMAAPGVVTHVGIIFGADVGWRWGCPGKPQIGR